MLFLRVVVLASCLPIAASSVVRVRAAAPALDLCSFTRTFAEEFDTLSVAAWELKGKRWIAHTPWNGDFGDAVFTDPQPDFPFFTSDGVLTIEARKGEDGKWRSGLLASTDPNTAGFAQMYGYFEARARLPAGPGVWPAFWLVSNVPRDSKDSTVEIDAIEFYGHEAGAFQSALHVWEKDPPRDLPLSRTTRVPSGSLSREFHRYGVDVTPTEIVYYLDREEIWRVPTPKEHRFPLTILVNLALGSGWPIDDTPNPSRMEVDYIHAYGARTGLPDPACRSW